MQILETIKHLDLTKVILNCKYIYFKLQYWYATCILTINTHVLQYYVLNIRKWTISKSQSKQSVRLGLGRPRFKSKYGNSDDFGAVTFIQLGQSFLGGPTEDEGLSIHCGILEEKQDRNLTKHKCHCFKNNINVWCQFCK